MLKKEKKLIITFPTTTAAFRTEKLIKEAKIAGRLIPLPQQISAECGLALCCNTGDEELINNAGISGSGRYIIEI